MKEIHQGSELEDGQNFVVLICDIDDIKSRMKNEGKDTSKEEIKEIYELVRRRLTNSVMEQFWYSIEAIVEEFKFETRL